jgi:putative transposase
MANTYHQMYVQTVFAVKYNEAVIGANWKDELFKVIGNLINEAGCKSLLVNGVEDHVHCFFAIKPSIAVSSVMQSAKAKSSKWINENRFLSHRFEWQEGFGSFTYGKSQVDAVYKYVQNQEAHHKKQTFREEYIAILLKFGVDFDERYIFGDLE